MRPVACHHALLVSQWTDADASEKEALKCVIIEVSHFSMWPNLIFAVVLIVFLKVLQI